MCLFALLVSIRGVLQVYIISLLLCGLIRVLCTSPVINSIIVCDFLWLFAIFPGDKNLVFRQNMYSSTLLYAC